MTSKRFATIATESYLTYSRMLYHSLIQSNPEAELTIFCDTELFPELFGHGERLHFRVLPSINELGVKRAKFDLYVEMSRESFTYLDSDIIVLEDLSNLFGGDQLSGCQDTLADCPFIENPDYPWPGDPTLLNRRYCNSGVLFFPVSMRDFLKQIRDLAQDDACWVRYIIPGGLYDNHFLCAMLNRFDVDFFPLDPNKFGIAGFRSHNSWNVTRLGKHLISQPSGEILHLAHFAYGQDPDFCFARMPAWLAAFLQDRGGLRTSNTTSRNTQSSPPQTVAQWISSEKGDLVSQIHDDVFRRVLGACAVEIDTILANPYQEDRGNESYFQNPAEFQDLLYSSNERTDASWKGLLCNGAYLTPLEYEFAEECIRRYEIKSVVESGAGETSAMFRAAGCSVVSIEWLEGPWAQRARAAGATVHIVSFDSSLNTFAESQLSEALNGVSSDLLFVDSPMGGERRRGVPEQFLKYIDPRYLLVHDVSRDHRNIFEWLRDKGWTLVEYCPSRRGVLLLQRSKPERASKPISLIKHPANLPVEAVTKSSAPAPAENSEMAFAWEIAVLGTLGPFRAAGRYFVTVALINCSNRILGSSASIHLSYHWRRPDGAREVVVMDGERSAIQPDLRPGESRRILCEILAPAEPGRYLLEWDLVEEGVTWFSWQWPAGSMPEVDVLSADEILTGSR